MADEDDTRDDADEKVEARKKVGEKVDADKKDDVDADKKVEDDARDDADEKVDGDKKVEDETRDGAAERVDADKKEDSDDDGEDERPAPKPKKEPRAKKRPSPRRPEPARAQPAGGGQPSRNAMIVIVAAIGVVGYAIYRAIPVKTPPPPSPEECIRSVLTSKKVSFVDADVKAGSSAIVKGNLDVKSSDKESLEYRAINDESVRAALEVCRSAYKRNVGVSADELSSAPREQLVATLTGTVSVIRSQGTREFAVAGAAVTGSGKVVQCDTRADGKCELVVHNAKLGDKLQLQAQLKDGSLLKSEPTVQEFVSGVHVFKTDASFSTLAVEVTDCKGKPVRDASVTCSAPDAILWGHHCGSVPPAIKEDCRSAQTTSGQAKFYFDKATVTKVAFRVQRGEKAVEEHDARDVKDLGDVVTLKYPKDCGGNGDGGVTLCPANIVTRVASLAKESGAGSASFTVLKNGSVQASGSPNMVNAINGKTVPQPPAQCTGSVTNK
jgi:hypothetical protein